MQVGKDKSDYIIFAHLKRTLIQLPVYKAGVENLMVSAACKHYIQLGGHPFSVGAKRPKTMAIHRTIVYSGKPVALYEL